ncbi:MAG: hypothetical protein Kow0031_24930 [Anaerolineae bacterium]
MIDLKKNPERTAWIILGAAFGVFCSLAVFVPASIYLYAISATLPLNAELTSVRGIVQFGDANAETLASTIVDGATAPLPEGFAASTNETSQAILTFADDSSVTMYGNTAIVLRQSQRPRFGISANPNHITVELLRGRIRTTAAQEQADLSFTVTTPHATVQLGQGSYSIEANEAETQVTTRFGEAEVTGDDGSVMLNQGQRAIIRPGAPPSPPLPAAQNLLADSDFGSTGLDEAWETYTITPIESVTTTANVVVFQNRPVLNLRSQGQDNIHSEVGVIQMVNKDVRDFQSLRVFAEVRLVNQSLPGGGQLGSEFPIMLHVAYKDAAGNDRDWFHGFYYVPPPENYIIYNQPDNSSERIARFVWYPYESVNLLTTLGPAKPVFVKSIRIYASGWIYDSMVANISLLAEE